jgi:hypothetical protein
MKRNSATTFYNVPWKENISLACYDVLQKEFGP